MALPTTLGTESIGRLLRQYAVPAIVAMTASSLYNMIDSIFIGQGVGPLAISGLAVTFPFMNLAAAFGSLVGVGASTMVSVKLGQKDYTTARKVLGNVVALNTIIGIAFMTISLIFLDKILLFFGASENTLSYARDYMEIILYGNVVTHMYLGLNAVMRSSGHPQKAMAMTIMTVILNAILDPIFIFGFGWGIRGAAIATILAQVVALAWLLIAFTNKKDILHFESGIFKLDKRIVTSSLSIGMAPFLMNIASCVIVIFINNGLQQHGGDLAIGAYGIINRITFIFVMVVMGLNQGMQPIAGYNYGARNIDRMLSVLKLTIVWATVIMCFGFVICEFTPELITRIFTTDSELIERSVRGMRIVAIFFPIIGMQMVTGNFFQSIGMARQAIFLSLTRQLIFLLPCLIVLPMFWGADGVWASLPTADLLSWIVSVSVLMYYLRRFKQGKIEYKL